MSRPGGPFRVLLVEDNPGDARLIREMLAEARAWEFAIQHVQRLAEGLALARPGVADIVLLDLGLPDSEGLETFLKMHAHAPQLPVIVLTALDDEAVALRALHENAQDCVTKGQLESGAFARAIRYAIERNRAEQPVRESELRLRAVIQNTPIVLFATDRKGKITLCQGSGLASVGVVPEDLEGRSLFDVLGEASELARDLRRALAGEALMTTVEAGGAVYQLHVAPERDVSGSIVGAIGVATDVTERLQTESQLKRTVEELQEKTAELESFTYTVSHDLKEPLRTLEAFSQFLLEDCGDGLDEQGKHYLDRIGKASARLKQMIEELLLLARVGKRPEEADRVDLGVVAANVVNALQAAVEEKSARIEIADGLPPVAGDVYRIEQIFGNLMSNALKFNQSEQPVVRIGVRGIEGGWATFYVQDNGIGIDPEYHDRIFEIFQQLHKREEYEGTGAGLAIVKRAVEAVDGRVALESVPGVGATFLVTLPLWEARAMSVEQRAA